MGGVKKKKSRVADRGVVGITPNTRGVAGVRHETDSGRNTGYGAYTRNKRTGGIPEKIVKRCKHTRESRVKYQRWKNEHGKKQPGVIQFQ